MWSKRQQQAVSEQWCWCEGRPPVLSVLLQGQPGDRSGALQGQLGEHGPHCHAEEGADEDRFSGDGPEAEGDLSCTIIIIKFLLIGYLVIWLIG